MPGFPAWTIKAADVSGSGRLPFLAIRRFGAALRNFLTIGLQMPGCMRWSNPYFLIL